MTPLFTTKTVYSEREYVAFTMTALRHNPDYWRNMGAGYLLLTACAIYGLVSGRAYLSVASILAVPLFAFLWKWALHRRIKRVYGTNRRLQDMESAFSLYEDRFEEVYPDGALTVSYGELYKIYETKTNVYLMLGAEQGSILVKESCSKELLTFLRKVKEQYGL